MNDKANSKKTFWIGVGSGFAAVCVIGFFVLLGMMLSGKTSTKNTIPTNAVGNEQQQVAQSTNISSVAKRIGINKNKFEECLNSGRHTTNVRDQYNDATSAGGRGTPYSIIVSGDTKIPVSGALPYKNVKGIIDSVINNTVSDEASASEIELNPISENDHIYGNKEAKISIVEFSDIECPFCKRFHPTAQQLVDDYKGEVNWIYRHFPLESLHPEAAKKAEATECVTELGGNDKFWEFLNILIKENVTL